MKHALSVALIAGAALAAPARGGDDFRLATFQPEAEVESVDPLDEWAVREDSWVRLRGAAWFADLSGEADFSDDGEGPFDGGSRSSVDFEDDLGLDDGQVGGMFTLGFNLGHDWHLNLGLTGLLSFDGSADDADIVVDGTNFVGNVEGDFRLDIYDVEVLHDLTDPEPVTWAVGGGVKVLVVDLKVEGDLAGGTGDDVARGEEDVEGVVPIPVLSTLVRWDMGRNFYLQGHASGMYAGDYGIVLDLTAEVGLDLNRNFGIFGGYRYLRAEADFDDESDEFEATIHGPFVGAELRF